jgi:hypothetical protein
VLHGQTSTTFTSAAVGLAGIRFEGGFLLAAAKNAETGTESIGNGAAFAGVPSAYTSSSITTRNGYFADVSLKLRA